MTDQELDKLMKKALLDAIKADAKQQGGGEQAFIPSEGYQRQISRMLKNPLKWKKRKETKVWKRVLQRAAIVLMVMLAGFGSVMVASPTARAAVLNWVRECYESAIVYYYSGEDLEGDVASYQVTALPEGFKETTKENLGDMADVVYSDGEGHEIWFFYVAMVDGVVTSFSTDHATVTDVTVNGMPGQFFESTVEGNFNTLTWMDTESNIQFTINGNFEFLELLHMAESVSLSNLTNK